MTPFDLEGAKKQLQALAFRPVPLELLPTITTLELAIAEIERLRAVLKKAADTLEEVRTGEDFEVECWNVAQEARALLPSGGK